MSKQLYEEALADVKKLKEIAEDNAKRAILEAVTPRIKDLIEHQLLGEAKHSDDKDLLLDDMPQSMSDELPAVDPEVAAAISMPDKEGKVTLDLSMLSSPKGEDYTLSMDDEKAVDALIPSEKVDMVKAESALTKLENKIHAYTKASAVLRETKSYLIGLVSTISEVEDMYSTLKNTKDSSKTENLIQRLKECHKTLKKLMEQETNMKKKFSLNEEDVTLTLKGLPDDLDPDDVEIELVAGGEAEEGEGEEAESEEDEESEGEDAFGGGDEEEEDEEEESDEEPEEGSEEKEEEKMETRWLKGDVVVEIDENMLRKEISRMRALREAADDVQDWGHGAGDLGDLEDEDLGDPLEMDLSEAGGDLDEEYDTDMDSDMDMDEGSKDDKEPEGDLDLEIAMQGYDSDEDGDLDEGEEEEEKSPKGKEPAPQKEEDKKPAAQQKEAIVRKLATEARIQAEAKKKAGQAGQAAKKKQKEAQQKMKEAHRQAKQKKMKEAQQKKKDAQDSAKKSKQMKEAYNYYAKQFNESVLRTRKLQSMLAEATARNGSSKNGASSRLVENTVELREKLAEMNLFNAKLLFTNKLLQNESLTKRQKAEVIERLDEAQNVREAKLVYESLVKALQGGSTGRTVTESAARGVIGSSSRPARPAATTTTTLNEGFEAERWAKLAGIIK